MQRRTWFPASYLAVVGGIALACAEGGTPTAIEPGGSADLSRRGTSVASVQVNPDMATVVARQTVTLDATALDSRGKTVKGASFTWRSDNTDVARVAGGVVTGVSVGQAHITATSSGVSGLATVSVVASPTPPPTGGPPDDATGWSYCVAAGASCDFIGLRVVRLGGAAGPYVQQTVYHTVPCASYAFDNQDPAPNKPEHCDYGPLLVTTIVNPMPGMAPIAAATVVVPRGAPGVGSPQTEAAGGTPSFTDGSGSFRTTCSLATYAFDDPIVYPGQPGASHLHAFFGNTGISASSTPATVAATGNSTCRGGTLNRTAYWVPALVDAGTGEIQTPDEGVFYYKTGYNVDPKTVRPVPVGLRMIAGNKLATGPQAYVTWMCRDHYKGDVAAIPTNCPVGDAVRLAVDFPQCWDGVHLDSPDHKSHMAYPNYDNPPRRSVCPATHPVVLPAISENLDFPVRPGSVPARWRLSSDMYSSALPGGYSAHADWMGGWDPATMATLVSQCLNKALDCQVGMLGNGRQLR